MGSIFIALNPAFLSRFLSQTLRTQRERIWQPVVQFNRTAAEK